MIERPHDEKERKSVGFKLISLLYLLLSLSLSLSLCPDRSIFAQQKATVDRIRHSDQEKKRKKRRENSQFSLCDTCSRINVPQTNDQTRTLLPASANATNQHTRVCIHETEMDSETCALSASIAIPLSVSFLRALSSWPRRRRTTVSSFTKNKSTTTKTRKE